MITPSCARTLAAYNAAMNRRLYAAAARLPDAVRRADGGAFWGSVHGTLCHLLWADRMWMSRFAGWPKPAVPLAGSAALVDDFSELAAAREQADAALLQWADGLDDAWLAGTQHWHSGSTGRDAQAPRALLVLHMFNHQTHHRGQAHALLTRAGASTGDTDLWLLVPQPVP